MVCVLGLLCLFPFRDLEPVGVTVRMPNPSHHFYEVEMVFPKVRKGPRTLKMANWTPGSYKIRDFARNVEQFGAFDDNDQPLSWRKTDKSTWVVDSESGDSFKIRYKVFAFEFSVRTSYLDSFYGFINPASVFFYEAERQNAPYVITVEPYAGWSVASSLPKRGNRVFYATNFDVLVDSPMQFGPFRRHDFDVAGIPHHWIIAGEVNMNEAKMVEALQKIGTTVGELFGGFPFENYYVFSQFRLDGAGGGLEHLNSTMVQAHSNNFRDKKGWDRFLGLMIHEYFHAWNVKAIRDKPLGPFDYENEVYTDLLWIHEGWTSYYDTMLMIRAGFWSTKELLREVAKVVDTYTRNPGTKQQSLTDASFNAWIHQYQPTESFGNSRVSYYREGAVSGLALDLLIRHKTKNEFSLDDIMRGLFHDYARRDLNIDLEIVTTLLQQVIGPAGKAFIETHVKQAQPMDMSTFLGYAGVDLVYEEAGSESNKKELEESGQADAESEPEPEEKPFKPNPKTSMGIEVRKSNGAIIIRKVIRDGPGWNAGLDYGDEILALNGFRVREGNYEKILGWSRPGDEVKVMVSRANQVLTLAVVLDAHPKKLRLVFNEDANSNQKKIFESLFKARKDSQSEQ